MKSSQESTPPQKVHHSCHDLVLSVKMEVIPTAYRGHRGPSRPLSLGGLKPHAIQLTSIQKGLISRSEEEVQNKAQGLR